MITSKSANIDEFIANFPRETQMLLELLQETKRLFPFLKVVMVSAYDFGQYKETANSFGADNYITNPVAFVALKATSGKLIAEW